MYQLNGKKITGAFQDAFGTQYPANWLAFSTSEDRAALGIVEVPDPVYPNPKTHFYVENTDGSLVATERPLADVQAEAIRRINNECSRRILARYDNNTQRSALMGIYGQTFLDTMKSDIASMIQTSNAACDAVNAATTVQDAVNAEAVTWPL